METYQQVGNNMQLKEGDILLIHSRTFIARIIQLGMNIERWRWFSFKPFWKKVANHAAICISGGYDGLTAKASLVAKGFSVYTN